MIEATAGFRFRPDSNVLGPPHLITVVTQMSELPVETIYAPDGKRRVTIFRRASGTFGYREEYHYKNDLADVEGWASLGGRACYYDDLETAKRELAENIVWLAGRTLG